MLTQLATERYRLYRDYFTKLGVSVLLLHATAVVIASLVVTVCTANFTAVVIASLVVTVCTANFYTKDPAFCPHSVFMRFM